MSSYRIGMFTGFLLIFLVIALVSIAIRRGRTGQRGEYDERQVLLRGRGMKYAYFTLILLDAVYSLAIMDRTKSVVDPALVHMGLIFCSGLVLLGYTIFTDAYWSLGLKNRGMLMGLWLVAICGMAFSAYDKIRGRKLWVDGQLTFDAGVPFLTLGFLLTFFVMLLIKRVLDRKGGEGE